MTYPPGGYPPQPYFQQPYPPQPYPGQPRRPSAGMWVTASILSTVNAAQAIWSLVLLVPLLSGWAHLHTPLGLVMNIVVVLTDVLMVLATILLWCRVPAGRVLAIVAVCLYLANDLYTIVTGLSYAAHFGVGWFDVLDDLFDVVVLVFLVLPASGRYLKARRAPQVTAMPYAPQQFR